MDTNGSGSINFDEFKEGIARTTGQSAPTPVLRAVWKLLDTDGNNSISYDEILQLLGEENTGLRSAAEAIAGLPDPPAPPTPPGQPATLVVDENFEQGEPIRIGFVASGGEERSWVGLYDSGAKNSDYVDWLYLNGSQEQNYDSISAGSITFELELTPGEYDVRLFGDGGYETLLASASFDIIEPEPEPEPVAEPEPEPVAEPEPEQENRGMSPFSIDAVVKRLAEAVTLSARKSAIDSLIGHAFPLAMKVTGLGRTIGPGLTKKLLFGTTVIASSALLGEVEMRLGNDQQTPSMGQALDLPVKITGWNFAHGRPILEMALD